MFYEFRAKVYVYFVSNNKDSAKNPLRNPKRKNVLFLCESVLRESSVADPGCLSRILTFFHPEPESRIQKQQQKRREKRFVVLPFIVATNIPKLQLFYFSTGDKKNLVQYKKNYRTFYTRNCH
jgi:hypothetical protein